MLESAYMSFGKSVSIFHESRPVYARIAAQAAEEAGWQPQKFYYFNLVMQSLPVYQALITEPGMMNAYMGVPSNQPLLEEARRLDLPVALLGASPPAEELVRANKRNIIIPTESHDEIAPALREWLGSLLTGPYA